MSAESNIYDFSGQIEPAIKAVFTDAEVKAFTAQEAPQFQKERPRVEVVFVKGQGRGQWFRVPGETAPRETAWQGALNLAAISSPDIATHNAFCVKIRNIMATIGQQINGNTLPFHKIQNFFVSGGETPSYTVEDGVYRTDISYNVEVSVQNNAWMALANLPVVIVGQTSISRGTFNAGGPPVDQVTPVTWFVVKDDTGSYLIPGYQ